MLLLLAIYRRDFFTTDAALADFACVRIRHLDALRFFFRMAGRKRFYFCVSARRNNALPLPPRIFSVRRLMHPISFFILFDTDDA